MRLPCLFLLLLFPAAVLAADTTNQDGITPEGVRAHVEFLADDLLEGREAGTRGHEIAARYVASQYLSMGLTPGTEKGWFQRVPLATLALDEARSTLSVAGQHFAHRQDVLIQPGRAAGDVSLEAETVFVGYGIDDPKNGQNDYAGLSVKGKFVAILSGFPKGMKSDVGAHYGRSKAKMAQARGAIGVITVRTLDRERIRPWKSEVEAAAHPAMVWTKADGAVFTETPDIKASASLGDAAASALFAGAPKPLATLLADADKKNGRPKGFALKQRVRIDRTTTVSTISSPNVIGLLPGSDPTVANEYVLLMAHLDHNGIDPKRMGDTVFNGAMDNASGTASMLEAARALAAGPNRPRRPILFAAVTAEEKGLLGSDYLANNPVVPAGGKIVAVVNLDMPVLLYDFTDVIAFGAEHSTMGQSVASAAGRMGVALSDDPLPEEGLFTRSDHYSFVKKGIPSVFLMTGFQNGGEKAFKDFLATHYHKVSDQTDLPFNWAAAAKFARINFMIAAGIANADAAPRWYQGSFFGNQFAPGALRAPALIKRAAE
ncbi:MAG: hypothetical protein RIS52_366 [Pseudomonadota bacterium]|jgi:hypothetical protein